MKKLLLILLCTTSVMALQAQSFWLSKSSVTIAGTSTMHDWTADVNKVWGNATMAVNNNALEGISALTVEMEVMSIKSPKGNMMDNNIYDALKAKKNPKISFVLSKVNSVKAAGGEFAVAASGNLTVAGVTKAMDLNVTAKMLPNGGIQFKGSKKFKMSDFKVDPPSFMFGAMKTGDDVTISFDVTFSK